MKKIYNKAHRLVFAGVALLMGFVVAAPSLLIAGTAAASGQVSSRSITLSTSAQGATGVTYTVKFTPATSETNPDVIVDFCSNSPLIGDSCTATAGTDVPDFTSAAASGWTVATIGTNRGVKLTTTTVSFTAGTPTTITITGVKNPSSLGTFYGRILTYATGGAGTNTSASPGTYVDYGGDALATVSNISITAKVFETLSFCIFDGSKSCGNAPSLTLGDPTTGALSTSNAYATNESGTNSSEYTLSTNAGGGVSVTMTGKTLCRSATPGTDCVPAAGNYNTDTIAPIGATAAVLAKGSEQFGMCADTTGATGGLAAQAPYNDTVNNCHGQTTTSNVYSGTSQFGFDDTTSTGTNSTGGSLVLKSTGAVSTYTGAFMFLADIAATTEAGIYTTSLNMVATSTF